ncbi:hypothetical protein RE628_10655 [Paenibacillus sp. D2_2]|uniref:hypothetical protein n=1 Tax=Paenibacillus sp. D2_2 TaxID=3073092 RepID=UPI0028165D88|nr:hypothetical protein [Paenibacillus sp. D2_2]WMT42715.1 hypothetical protein RE628_10655 [Paenibacillus sp. D2_2]
MKVKQYLSEAYRSIYENDFEKALYWFEQALSIEPDNADLHYRHSITSARSNCLDKALVHASIATTLAPNHKEYVLHFDCLRAKELLGIARRHLEGAADDTINRSERAVRLLARAGELDPLSVEVQAWLAIAYGEMGRYDAALSALREAYSLPQDEVVTRQLAELEQQLENKLNQSST